MATGPQTRYLLETWAAHQGIAQCQLSSFDHFAQVKLQEIVKESSLIRVENEKRGIVHEVTFGKVSIRSPAIRESDGSYHSVTPQECRLRGISYNLGVYVDVAHSVSGPGSLETSDRVYVETLLCKIPCMVRSSACTLATGPNLVPSRLKECPLDTGGYFIVNGNEKAVVAQEKLRTNYPFCKRTSQRSCTAEVRSLHAAKTRSTSTLVITMAQKLGQRAPSLTVALPFVDCVVPVAAIFRLLGFESKASIIIYLQRQIPPKLSADLRRSILEILDRSVDDSLLEQTPAAVLEWIGKEGTKEPTSQRRARYVEHILANEFLPHMGLTPDNDCKMRKATYLSFVIIKLALVYIKALPEDDRDDFGVKRVEVSGTLFSLLFRQLFRGYLKMLTVQLQRNVEMGRYVNIVEALSPKKITQGFKFALNTGSWGVQKSASQNGVAQVMTRMNFLANTSHLRRVSTPINRDGKLPKPRELSTSHYGILCPVETPEGQACGLVENFSFLSHVRIGAPACYVVRMLSRENLITQDSNEWRVLVNGSIEGFCADGKLLAETLRELRRAGVLPFDSSIYTLEFPQWSVSVDVDPGCLMRPLLRAGTLHLLPSYMAQVPPPLLWKQLLSSGVVELVDKNEERNAIVAAFGTPTPQATHFDFHPATMLGVCAGAIPFLNHNQAPRNIYESAMAKQSIGGSSLACDQRVDAVSHVLHYPQVPLVRTDMLDAIGYAQTPCSCNAMVAILSHSGFNQEDSLIFNKAAIDRGLFRSTVFKSIKDEEKGVGSDLERFGNVPPTAVGARQANYAATEEDGMPAIRTLVGNSDVIVSKKMNTLALGADRKKKKEPVVVDHSTVLSASEPMRVSKAYLTTNKDGARLLRVRLHAVRIPDLGDKFASVHGQKGVIGMILRECDMPYCEDGSVPDIIINPHAIPSRMTVAQLIESILGKVSCIEGREGDGTPFNKTQVEDIASNLRAHGFDSMGNECMFNGITGERFETTVFLGPTSYQKLRHCVVDKVHARSRGPRQLITRQPVEGRSRGGGLRVGEMERDCMLAHGASGVLLDRMFMQSDVFSMSVCRKCGLIAESLDRSTSPAIGAYREYCRNCRHSGPEHIASVSMPYSAKLLSQELAQLNVAMRFRVGGSTEQP
jgi:DNA-directed RNA polymerase II subunit RPB2